MISEQERDILSRRSNPYHQINFLVRHSDVMPGLPFEHFQISQDAKTIIEKLMCSSKLDKKNQSSSRKQIDSNNNISQSCIPLEATQIKIFNEVIGLLDEIQGLKKQVAHQQAQTLRLQSQRAHYLNKTSSKKMKLPSLNDLQLEKHKLLRKLKKIQARRGGGLQKLLKEQKQKYQLLKKQMQVEIRFANEDEQEQIQIQSQVLRLKQANQNLRVKIQLLKNTENYRINLDDTQKKRQLEEYVMIQQQNKYAFLADLDKFRRQYQELLNQNKQLEKKIKNKDELLSFSPKKYQKKVNIQVNMINKKTNNAENHKSISISPFKLKTDNNDRNTGYISKQKKQQWRQKNGTTKFGQYVDLVHQMKDILDS